MIRWSVQKGFITIPKSSKPERIKENMDVFDWTLSDDDMKILVRINHPVKLLVAVLAVSVVSTLTGVKATSR